MNKIYILVEHNRYAPGDSAIVGCYRTMENAKKVMYTLKLRSWYFWLDFYNRYKDPDISIWDDNEFIRLIFISYCNNDRFTVEEHPIDDFLDLYVS